MEKNSPSVRGGSAPEGGETRRLSQVGGDFEGGPGKLGIAARFLMTAQGAILGLMRLNFLSVLGSTRYPLAPFTAKDSP